jgi:hypothetical protein
MAITYSLAHGFNSVKIFHDFTGIEDYFIPGARGCRSKTDYGKFCGSCKGKIDVEFHKVSVSRREVNYDYR